MLIVLSGLPGTGKSAGADAIARACLLPVLSVDPLEAAILRAGIAPGFETGLAACLVAETLADRFLGAGLDAQIDAVNSVNQAREMWRALARKHHIELRIIECIVADPVVHAARLASRGRGLALPEPTGDDVERRRAEWTGWPEPHLDAGRARRRRSERRPGAQPPLMSGLPFPRRPRVCWAWSEPRGTTRGMSVPVPARSIRPLGEGTRE